MSTSTPPPFESLLQMIAQATPRPWYPIDFTTSKGVPHDRLDGPLDQLRVAGLVAFTPWVGGKGQGYELTPHGIDVLRSPRLMAGLRRGYLPAAREVALEEDHDPQVSGTILGRGDAVRRALANPGKPQLTKALIIINIIVFGVALFIGLRDGAGANTVLVGGNLKVLRLTGAVSGADLVDGQWWRLLTCCFVHIGGLHLAMNMYCLWVLGSQVENLWGRYRFLIIYLLSGLGGSCAAMAYNPHTILAGASGAIWGIMASFPTWLLINRVHLPKQLVSNGLSQMSRIILINVFISFIPGISWTAHFGGALVGAVVAILLNQHRFGRDPVRWLWIGLVAVIPVLCVGGVIRQKESDVRWRKEVREAAENKRDKSAQEEIADYNKNHINEVLAVRTEAEAAADAADELRTKFPPNQRPKPAVADRLNKLQAARARIEAAERRLENAGPYDSEFMRGIVAEALKGFVKLKDLVELHEKCLTEGDRWPAGDDDQFERASQRENEAWSKYDQSIVRKRS